MTNITLLEIHKQRLIAEDVAWGLGTINQERDGALRVYNEINAKHMPTDNGLSVQERFDELGDAGYSKVEADSRFAALRGSNETSFRVGTATLLTEATRLDQVIEMIANIPQTDQSVGADDAGKLTKLGQLGKLSSTFMHVADKDDIVGDGNDGYFIVSGEAHRESVIETVLKNATDEYNPADPTASAMKITYTKPDGKIDLSLLGLDLGVELEGAWLPIPAGEYPPSTTVGHVYIIDGLGEGVGYTFVAGDLTGREIFDADFMVLTNTGWGMVASGLGATVYYNVSGTLPLEAKLNSGGYGSGNTGDILGATVDIESGEKPRVNGYVIDSDDNNDIIHEFTEVADLEPSGGVIKKAELFINLTDKKVYTVDEAGDSVLLGGAIAEDAEKLGGLLPSDYARTNGNDGQRFKVSPAQIGSEAPSLDQMNTAIYDGFRDTDNTRQFVPSTRTINGKPLLTNINLSNSDVGAAHTDIAINGNKFSDRGWDMSLGASDVGALPIAHQTVGASETALGHTRMAYSNGRLDIWTS